jgi:TonB-linked SusC/RagA family outer membrane protein
MESALQGKRWIRAAAMSVSFALLLCEPAFGQQAEVSGRVTSPEGTPIPGVTVRIRGTTTSTVTGADGRYSIAVPSDAVLLYNLIGYRGLGQSVGGRSTIDVVMEQAVTVLPEVVVTGYTSQRRADITGAVSSVDIESANKQTSTSALQRLDGRVPGVTIENSGAPGSRTTVRIRGITSFQNNDPLYIIDGTPVQDSYLNWLSPDDIGEVQVLKDASAASIYGSRASNGVVIIETKKGRAGPRRMTLDVRTGVSTPARGYDDFLMQDALQYFEVVKRGFLNAGDTLPDAVRAIYGTDRVGNNPSVAAYIFPNNGRTPTTDTLDLSTYSWPGPDNKGTTLIMPGSAGTNWWDAVFGSGQVTDANLRISGGGADNAYNVSFNFLNQEGTAAFNRLQRGTVRVNTAFNLDRLVVGENIALSRDQHFGGIPNDDGGEDGILGKNILMQPIVPVYDIRGNFASGKAVSLGNNSNPLAYAWNRQFDRNTNDRIMGNVFAGMELAKNLSVKTRIGFNLSQQSFRGYNPITPENSEPGLTNSIDENDRQTTDWTWSNTLTYMRSFERHSLSVLVGQGASQTTTRYLEGSIGNLLNTDPSSRYIQDFLGSAPTKDAASTGNTGRLLSVFGKADYNFAEKYYLSVTLRRDGSSKFAPGHRWGTFPAFNVGWRLSQEPFFAGNFFSNAMLRFGWGITGNENIPLRTVSRFGGGRGDAFYDIPGSGTTVLPGYIQTSLGNPDLKWEENKSANVGVDLAVFQGRGILTVDVYQRQTDNLLFPPRTPATAGAAAPPLQNVGSMRNRGVDVSLGYRGTLGDRTAWSVTLNGSHYKNKIVRIDNAGTQFFFGPNPTRLTDHVINMVGHPIGAFYGYQADGYFLTGAEIAQLDTAARIAAGAPGDTTIHYQDGEAPGRLRFRDVNGDGRVTASDKTVIGSPHPDFTAGLDLSVRRGAWDLSVTVFGTFGNQIFDDQKDFYVFRDFSTNVRNDLLTNSFCLAGDDGCTKPNDPNAKYPRIDNNDSFSRAVNSYYVEDGSYVRLRNLQIGYTVPPAWIRWIPAARIYVQVENLFTITGYDGLDAALPAANQTGASDEDIRDQYRGVDRGSYPSSRTFTIGISTSF